MGRIMSVQLAPGKEKMSDQEVENLQGQTIEDPPEEEKMLLSADVLPQTVIEQLQKVIKDGRVKIPVNYLSPMKAG